MMTKTRLCLTALALFVLLSLPAVAVWDKLPRQEWLGPQNAAFADGHNVKVLEVDVEERTAEVRVSRDKKIVFQGEITETEGYTQPKRFKVRAEDFRHKDAATQQVLLEMSKWAEASIDGLNFPAEVYKHDAYKVFVILRNPGQVENRYKVELSGTGPVHMRKSSQAESPKFRSSVKNPVKEVTQEVTIEPGKSKKVYFEMQPAGTKTAGKTISPLLRIRGNSGALIRQIDLEDIEVVSRQVGYIEDLIVPTGMLSGEKGEVKVRVRNSWIAAENDFRVDLRAPEFKLNPARPQELRAFTGITEEVTYTAIPYGGGKFTLTAELSIGRDQVDTLSVDVPVVGENIYTIKKVEAPETVQPGESEIVFITVENRGKARNTFSLRLDSKEFTVQNPDTLLKLSAGEDTKVMYNIKAPTDEDIEFGDLEARLFDIDESFETRRRYTRDRKVADSKKIRIGIDHPEEPEPEPAEETEEEVTQDTTTPDTTEEETETDSTQEEEETRKRAFSFQDLEGLWPYIAIGVLVLLAIIMIIMGEKKRGGPKEPNMDVYDLDEFEEKLD